MVEEECEKIIKAFEPMPNQAALSLEGKFFPIIVLFEIVAKSSVFLVVPVQCRFGINDNRFESRFHPLHDVLGPSDRDQLPPPDPCLPGHDAAAVALLHGVVAQHVREK